MVQSRKQIHRHSYDSASGYVLCVYIHIYVCIYNTKCTKSFPQRLWICCKEKRKVIREEKNYQYGEGLRPCLQPQEGSIPHRFVFKTSRLCFQTLLLPRTQQVRPGGSHSPLTAVWQTGPLTSVSWVTGWLNQATPANFRTRQTQSSLLPPPWMHAGKIHSAPSQSYLKPESILSQQGLLSSDSRNFKTCEKHLLNPKHILMYE